MPMIDWFSPCDCPSSVASQQEGESQPDAANLMKPLYYRLSTSLVHFDHQGIFNPSAWEDGLKLAGVGFLYGRFDELF